MSIPGRWRVPLHAAPTRTKIAGSARTCSLRQRTRLSIALWPTKYVPCWREWPTSSRRLVHPNWQVCLRPITCSPASAAGCAGGIALELAGLLHPTPAVCGVPTSTARAIIERNEPERGWYTGGVGWMNADGSGEFAVALRSLLIEGSKLTAWAGAGIVEGSDADAEFDETEFKLGALLGSSDR